MAPLELFFDLVFVFAFTQVTGFMADDPTWGGVLRGMLVLAAVWWAWSAFAWFTNSIDPTRGRPRLAMLAAMAAMLVAALAVPSAFGDDALTFGLAYLAVRALHVVLFAVISPESFPRSAVLRFLPTALLGPVLIVAASAFDGPLQTGLWALALAIDLSGVLIGGAEGWQLSPAHFAERFGLIVIIALGESIVAIGVAAGVDLGAQEILAALLGLAMVAALWWAYFDHDTLEAEERLTELEGIPRATLARDAYAYLHLLLIAGIVLFALGMKKTLEHTGDALGEVPAFALCGGVALYLWAHVVFRRRALGTVNRVRAAGALLALIVWPIALEIPALVALAALCVVTVALVAYEAGAYARRPAIADRA